MNNHCFTRINLVERECGKSLNASRIPLDFFLLFKLVKLYAAAARKDICRLTNNSLYSNTVIIKYNTLGEESWVRYYDYPPYPGNHPTGIAIDEDANVYVTGTSEFGTYGFTLKYNTTGYVQWISTYSTGVTGLTLDENSSLYITSGPNIIIYNSDGELKSIISNSDTLINIYDLIIDENSYIYATGYGLLGTDEYIGITVKYSQSTPVEEVQLSEPTSILYDVIQTAKNIIQLRFILPKFCQVHFSVYDATGRKILEPLNGNFSKGIYSVDITLDNSGVYFYTISFDDYQETGKFILLY